MTDVRPQLEAVFEKLATVIPEPGDYVDPASDLLLCGKCHTPKQCKVEVLGKMRVLPCICRCEHERHEAEKAVRKERDRLDRVRRLKANGLQDKALLAYTFDLDDGTNPAMRYARNYVAHWRELKERGRGLLLWGGVGAGKTFAAACIANALTEQGVPVLMTNFVKILNSLSVMFSEDRNKYLSSFNQFPLLIIDDLGIERSSEFAQEQVYSIVDSRYLSHLPFIITTNLALSELQNPPDLARARIYDRIYARILERCVPICFSGKNYRTENAVRNREDAAGNTAIRFVGGKRLRIKINEKISVDVPPAQEVPDQVLASFAQYLLPKIQDYYASQAERQEHSEKAARDKTARIWAA